MKLFRFAFLSVAFVVQFAQSGEPSRFELNLASDTAWTLRCDNGPARPIKVPGGGWNSDLQSPRIDVVKDVKDFVLYERKITVPQGLPEQAVKLRFGAVSYGCEVFLDGKKVGEHHGPQVAFDMDLTGFVIPGKEQTLQVKAYHQRHYWVPSSKYPKFKGYGQKTVSEVAVGFDFNMSTLHKGNSKMAYGISRSITLELQPAVHVEDCFIRSSVTNRQLSCDIWLHNTTATTRTLTLGATLSSWNKRDWRYPAIPPVSVTVPPGQTVKATLGPVAWDLGPESYWWPNLPFREEYQAQLHFLNLAITEGAHVWQRQPQRFGFVEHGEGPFYYTVNGVRVTGISDGTTETQMSFHDTYTSPAFMPPTAPGTGCPETWRRYMRVGININRLSCSPPTAYMLEAADEVGFLLIPETPIWGNGLSTYTRYTPQTYHDLGRVCRNHPSVARYSLTNEVKEEGQFKPDWPWRAAIDDMREVDDSRPLVYELSQKGMNGKITGIKGGHAWLMQHYADITEKVGEGKGIRGMGEQFWNRLGTAAEEPKGMGQFAVGVRLMRYHDWAYVAGWSWINYWPNFLEGMNAKLHGWRRNTNNNTDRRDGIDGWGSPIVQFAQRSFHPYLVQDIGLLKENPGDPRLLPGGKIEWPYQLPTLLAGQPLERHLAIFNGGLTGNRLMLRWRAHWDSPTGPEAVKGDDIPCTIEPGFHATQTVAFTVPKIETGTRKLYLVLESLMDGKCVFRNEETCFNIMSRQAGTVATFLRSDDKTQGNWEGKFGTDGYELIGHETKLPAYAKFVWVTGKEWIYDKATADPRALRYFVDPPTGKERIAACRYGDEVTFTLDAGPSPRRLSFYFLDYDNKGRQQTVELLDAKTGKSLDKQQVAEFAEGRYLSWNVQGAVKVAIRKLTGKNAVINGIFFDPVLEK